MRCGNCGKQLADSSKPLAIVLIIAGLVIGSVFAYLFIHNADFGKRSKTNKGFHGGGGGSYISSVSDTSGNQEATPMPEPTRTVTPAPEPTRTALPPAETPAPEPTRAPVSTPRPNVAAGSESAAGTTYYTVYENHEYGISCIYPMQFRQYDDSEVLYAVKSPGGTARERINVEFGEGKTPQSERDRYISAHSGTLEGEAVGSDYYMLAINSGENTYFKYCEFSEGYMYSFEFIYPSAQNEIYDRCIEDIFEEFTIY